MAGLSAAAIAAIMAGASATGGLVAAQGTFGETDKERLKELEQAGLTVESEEGLRALSGEMLDPVKVAASEEEEERRRRFTPFAAQGLFGAVARGTQGSEERMARSLEIPQMKFIEERRRKELQEEEEEQRLRDLKQEKRREQVMAVLGGAEKLGYAAAAHKSWKDQQLLLDEEKARLAEAHNVEGMGDRTVEEIARAAKRAGVYDQLDASVRAQYERSQMPYGLTTGGLYGSPQWTEADIENAQRRMEAMRGLQVGG